MVPVISGYIVPCLTMLTTIKAKLTSTS